MNSGGFGRPFCFAAFFPHSDDTALPSFSAWAA